MMKKLTALLLSLTLACLMSAMCLAEADPLYTGEWYLKTMIQGDNTMDVAAMGLNAVLTLNADGTCTFTGLGSDSAGTWTDDVENNEITVTIDDSPVKATLSDGELTLSDGDMSMIFTREAPVEEPAVEIKEDAAAEEFNGTWNCIALEAVGVKMNADALKAAGQELPVMTFQDGSFHVEGGALAASFAAITVPLTYADGTYSLVIDTANVSIIANILQNDTMALKLTAGDVETVLYFERAE